MVRYSLPAMVGHGLQVAGSTVRDTCIALQQGLRRAALCILQCTVNQRRPMDCQSMEYLDARVDPSCGSWAAGVDKMYSSLGMQSPFLGPAGVLSTHTPSGGTWVMHTRGIGLVCMILLTRPPLLAQILHVFALVC